MQSEVMFCLSSLNARALFLSGELLTELPGSYTFVVPLSLQTFTCPPHKTAAFFKELFIYF